LSSIPSIWSERMASTSHLLSERWYEAAYTGSSRRSLHGARTYCSYQDTHQSWTFFPFSLFFLFFTVSVCQQPTLSFKYVPLLSLKP
jgi:hypothetical protein